MYIEDYNEVRKELLEGFYSALRLELEPLVENGLSIPAIRKHLNNNNVRTFKGQNWNDGSVSHALSVLGLETKTAALVRERSTSNRQAVG